MLVAARTPSSDRSGDVSEILDQGGQESGCVGAGRKPRALAGPQRQEIGPACSIGGVRETPDQGSLEWIGQDLGAAAIQILQQPVVDAARESTSEPLRQRRAPGVPSDQSLAMQAAGS